MTFSKESKYNQFNIKSQEESCRNKYKKPDLPFWKIRLPVVPAGVEKGYSFTFNFFTLLC